MDSLPPIPTPVAQRWREFRIQVLPLLVFVGVITAVALLWKDYVQPVGIVGEVETVRANVIPIQEGTLVELTVDRFERVSKDQPIGKFVTTDSALQEVELNAIAADLKLMQARMELDKKRNFDSFSRKRLDLLTEKVNINIAQTKLTQAESQLQRIFKLYKEGPTNIASESELEIAVRDRDALQTEIIERNKVIAQVEQDVQQMLSAGFAEMGQKDPVIEEGIKAQQEKLNLLVKPTTLKAPIDGTVRLIYKHPGEKLVRGEPILTITASTSDRIVGYMRQPLGTIPTTNDTVQVRTRSLRRQIANAPILRVGTQMETINPGLLSPDGTRIEVGLPFLVGIPEGMRLVPGEFVDLAIQYNTRGSAQHGAGPER